MKRFILHSDLNNFYASVECLYNPKIRNKAVVVVGDESKRHGIVLAKNYIAKDYGINTGDTVYSARQKCNKDLVCVGARLDLYLSISKLVKDIYREYSDRVESFGIDEAWIDISHIVKSYDEAIKIANNIRCRVINEIGLTVSIGISFNKVFAKLGSDLKKPNGLVVIREDNFKDIVWGLNVSDLLYVGRQTTKKFVRANIKSIGDLATADKKYLQLTLGKIGEKLWEFSNGLDFSPVTSYFDSEKIKSFGNSTTCPVDLKNNMEVRGVICVLAESVIERMKRSGFYGTVVSLWVRDNTLESFERQVKLNFATNLVDDVVEYAYKLFLKNYKWEKDIRALGVRIGGLVLENDIQCDIFDKYKNDKIKSNLENVIENLRERFGYSIIRRGNIMVNEKLLSINPDSEKHIIHPRGFFKGV